MNNQSLERQDASQDLSSPSLCSLPNPPWNQIEKSTAYLLRGRNSPQDFLDISATTGGQRILPIVLTLLGGVLWGDDAHINYSWLFSTPWKLGNVPTPKLS